MTLSSCSQCKNYSEEVCLLGQSYTDVFNSIQNIADEQERQHLCQYVASCAYWEESDLSKLFSHEVTLSYHAWNRLAYMKIQNSDQELFQNLINAARTILLQQRQAVAPVAAFKPSEEITPEEILIQPETQKDVSKVEEDMNKRKEEAPEAMAIEESGSVLFSSVPPLDSATENAVDEVTAFPPQVQDTIPLLTNEEASSPASAVPTPTLAQVETDLPLPAVAEAVSSVSVVPMPTPVKLPSTPPPFHPELASQPGGPIADDPIEVAMQELWVMATSARNGAHHGQRIGAALDVGRGSGRVDSMDDQ